MTKAKRTNQAENGLPQAPWIYVNDTTEIGQYAIELATVIPKVDFIQLNKPLTVTSAVFSTLQTKRAIDQVVIITGSPLTSDASVCCNDVQLLREKAIKLGCNFASVNIADNASRAEALSMIKTWGPYHLLKVVDAAPDLATIKKTTKEIYQWLFSKFSVAETLHLIPDDQMQAIDRSTAFRSYEYCLLANAHKQPKDKRIQFVTLILTKPVVEANKRISWQVADKSGTANFYFQYRGPSSQYTWDWVLGLKAGDRRSLPRMPSLLVKEAAITTVIKAPFRMTGLAIHATGFVVKRVGTGLCKAGHKIKLGNRSEWIPEKDVGIDSKGRLYKKPQDDDSFTFKEAETTKTDVKVFTAKGEKIWKDNDSIASTTAGSIVDEKSKLFD